MSNSPVDINNFDAIEISIASPKKVRSWSWGEVLKPETINYRTLKPEKDGLFCERIFGPTKDWECYCGKYKRVRYKGIVCERCGVEVTRSKVRRERMAHVDLAAPVSHIWFFKGVPSRIGYLIDMAPKELEKVLYFAASMVTWVDEEARAKDLPELEKEVEKVLAEYEGERNRTVKELEDSLKRRIAYIESGEQGNFSDDDHLWAEGLGHTAAQLRKLKDEDREKLVKELNKDFDAEIGDAEAWIEEAIERLERVWKIFGEMKPRDVINDEADFRELQDRFGSPFGWGEYFRGGMGAEAVRDLLEQIDLEALCAELEDEIATSKGQKYARAVKRLKVASAFLNSDNRPEWMVLDSIPVIPPELRPMVQLDGGRFATSDLNDLYRRVINRNNRLKRLLDLGAPEIIVNNEKRMLQESVDALFDNGRRGRPVTGPGNRALKSLSDMLKGKQGRFRQNLLGKRVDYSGRSVIVAGPSLKLHQCGLPKLMALELFKPFIMAQLVEREAVQNIKAAKKMVESMVPEVWDVLEEVIEEHPVLLNRAPTLHRLGIQAFEPILVEGKAIQIHPLVCAAFNADFDGDQMAVHVPLSAEAQAEARILMLSSNNILSPANGSPLATPTQDMVLGLYYLTFSEGDVGEIDSSSLDQPPHPFKTAQEAELAYENGVVGIHDYAEYRRPGQDHFLTTVGRIIFNDRIERALAAALEDEFDPKQYSFVNQPLNKREINDLVAWLVEFYGAPAVSQVLDSFKDLGFQFASRAGITVSKNDVIPPPEKDEIIARFEEETSRIQSEFDEGWHTAEERHRQVTDKWNQATDEVGAAMEANLETLNPIFMMADSGARGSFKQIRQLAGMRGLMANPKGEIIERPIKSNFIEGLSVGEYFISTHGARKGLADTALRTADSGYLTRRLVDVAQDVIVRIEDCKTKESIEMPVFDETGMPNVNLVGRLAAAKFETKRGRELLKRNQVITKQDLDEISEAYEGDADAAVPVRSALKCEADHGVCRSCYGIAPATGYLAVIGDSVGTIAAQSIGEPGTQLTMRTFHTGGVAGQDITQGLPRVVELFEARKPKGLAVMSEVAGKVSIEETDKQTVVTVMSAEGVEEEYSFPPRTRLLVSKGDKVEVGDQLNEGSLYPADVLAIRGRTAVEQYLIAEVQRVYEAQGVEIDDKHIEIIVRQMLKKVEIETKGSTDLLPGQLVDRHKLKEINKEAKADGGTVAKGTEKILGITKAALATESFLSAASFQETTKVLTDAAMEGKRDRLVGLKENVIIGKLIPAATGLNHYRSIVVEPTEPFTPPEEAALLEAESIASNGDADGFGESFAEEIEEISAEVDAATEARSD